jgi:hypothetical protein
MAKYLQGASSTAPNAFLSSTVNAISVNGDSLETSEEVQRIVVSYPFPDGEGGVGVQDITPEGVVWSVNIRMNGDDVSPSNPVPTEITFRTEFNGSTFYPISYDTPLPTLPVSALSANQSAEQDISVITGNHRLAYFGGVNQDPRRDYSYLEALIKNDTDSEVIIRLDNWTFGFSNPVVLSEYLIPAGNSEFIRTRIARGAHELLLTSYGSSGTLRYSVYLS